VILSDKDILRPDDFFTQNKSGFSHYNSALTLEEMEKQLIRQALDRNNGNFSAAAAQLGVTRQTLYNKMKKSKL
jgi:transcriptional regulator with PAS, ATPase and Fis domain